VACLPNFDVDRRYAHFIPRSRTEARRVRALAAKPARTALQSAASLCRLRACNIAEARLASESTSRFARQHRRRNKARCSLIYGARSGQQIRAPRCRAGRKPCCALRSWRCCRRRGSAERQGRLPRWIVIPGSTAGVNPVYHPEYFGRPPDYACCARFHTYEVTSEPYLGGDGRRHPCRRR
jgi:hypothetical protein